MVTFEKFKEALGETAKGMTESEILKLMSLLDYLSDYWLDKVETEIFGCPIKTLLEQ